MTALAATATLELDGAPLRATGAEVRVSCATTDGSDPQPVIDRAIADSAVANPVAAGFPVAVRFASAPLAPS